MQPTATSWQENFYKPHLRLNLLSWTQPNSAIRWLRLGGITVALIRHMHGLIHWRLMFSAA
jgi:hypothetical protein